MRVRIGVGAAVLCVCAMGAQGDITTALGLSMDATPIETASPEGPGVVDVDVSSMVHNNRQGSVWNRVMRLDLGEDLWVTGLGWDLEATTIDPMLLTGVSIAIVNSDGDGIVLQPFSEDAFVGTASSETSEFFRLGPNDQAFQITDGVVYIEFFLPSNPIAGPEATYSLGSMLSLQVSNVPAPGMLAMGLGALGIASRRRRS